MKKMSNYDRESEIIRKMGLDPDRMTIRQRHEAIYGPVPGESFVDLVNRLERGRAKARDAKKQPTRSVSKPTTPKKRVSVPTTEKKPVQHTQSSADKHYGNVIRVANVPIITVPRFERKDTPRREKFDPKRALDALGAGPKAYELYLSMKQGKMDLDDVKNEPEPRKKPVKRTKGTTKRANDTESVVQLSLGQGFLTEVLEFDLEARKIAG